MSYRTRFLVQRPTRGAFPLDMLRYDACYPASPEDVGLMAPDWSGVADIEIELIHVGTKKDWHPTAARWESFGWKVLGVKTFRA